MSCDELVRRLRAVSTTEIMTMYDLTREAAKEIEALQRDAARYRWLRDEFRESNWYAKFFLLNGGKFDAAVDAAMKDAP